MFLSRFLGRILSGVVSIALIIVLFPSLTKLSSALMPDESGSSIKTSVVLAANLENTARLETMKVKTDGVLLYDINAAFIGTVSTINIVYTYEASLGIDLTKVGIHIDRNTITFVIPKPEVLTDRLTPLEVYHDDFWYPGFDKEDYDSLVEKERLAQAESYLSGENLEAVWESTQIAFEETIAIWMKEANPKLEIRFQRAEQ